MTRPDLDRIKQGVTHALAKSPDNAILTDMLALVAWVEHLEAEIAALEVRLPDVISVRRRTPVPRA